MWSGLGGRISSGSCRVRLLSARFRVFFGPANILVISGRSGMWTCSLRVGSKIPGPCRPLQSRVKSRVPFRPPICTNRGSNPRPLGSGSNSLTTRPRREVPSNVFNHLSVGRYILPPSYFFTAKHSQISHNPESNPGFLFGLFGRQFVPSGDRTWDRRFMTHGLNP